MYARAGEGKGGSDEDWSPHRQFLDADGMLELAVGGFLLRGGPLGDRVVLVDAGVGPRAIGRFSPGLLLDSLAGLDVQPADVTDVIFTHLHFDHIGWAALQEKAVFERAVYRCDDADFQHFLVQDAPSSAAELHQHTLDALDPVRDRIETFNGGGTLLAGVDYQPAPGHTPGSTIIVISHRNERAMLLGDVVHCPVELMDDEWAGIGDVSPALALRTRQALLRELEGEEIPVAATHFPGLRFGRLLHAESARQWVISAV
jgi:glyoxylase-like metal-dependent hydrolase (beta-lactamase superfamily II)